MRYYRLTEGKLSASKSRKDLEQIAAVVPGELRVGQSLLSEREISEVFQEARWGSWGLDLTSQALQTNANCNPVCEHMRELLCLYLEVLALEKAGCCQTSITDVLLGKTTCCGLRSLRVRPQNCTANCSKIALIFFPSYSRYTQCALFLCKINKGKRNAVSR